MPNAQADEIINNGMHRFLADGVHYRDLLDIRAAIQTWPDWCRVWSDFAATALGRGEAALKAGARATAAREFVRASIYYHYGQNAFFDDLGVKRATQQRKVAAFLRAAPLLDPPVERADIPFEGTVIPGLLRLPKGVSRPPCALLLGGLDTTKEDFINVSDLCVERGLATFAFDGPGQGEMAWTMRWRPDFERAIYAVIDYLERRPEVDAGRIGLIGRSLGGHYGPKAAAGDSRLKAVVAWGVCYEIKEIRDFPKMFREGWLFMLGVPTVDEAEKLLQKWLTLEGIARNIKCPLQIVHGGLDRWTPLPQATRLAAEVGGVVEELIWNDSIHCCHDRSHIVRPAMADFLVRHL
jgi:2,6-dihydroxypseudooxynicotine hydrolase